VGELTLAAYRADGYLNGDEEYADELRDARRRAEHTELLVAVDPASERILGTVSFCLPGTPFAELSRDGEAEFRMLAVDGAARGRGVGESLVRHCVGRARELGCAALVLCSLPEMRAAHRIYERLGFRRAPDRDWRPEPEILLVCYVLDL